MYFVHNYEILHRIIDTPEEDKIMLKHLQDTSWMIEETEADPGFFKGG